MIVHVSQITTRSHFWVVWIITTKRYKRFFHYYYSMILCLLPSLIVSQGFAYLSIVTVMLPVTQIFMTASIYLTLSITIERYTTVCHPWYKVLGYLYYNFLIIGQKNNNINFN